MQTTRSWECPTTSKLAEVASAIRATSNPLLSSFVQGLDDTSLLELSLGGSPAGLPTHDPAHKLIVKQLMSVAAPIWVAQYSDIL